MQGKIATKQLFFSAMTLKIFTKLDQIFTWDSYIILLYNNGEDLVKIKNDCW